MALAFHIKLPSSQPKIFPTLTLLIPSPTLLETGAAIFLEEHPFVILFLATHIPVSLGLR